MRMRISSMGGFSLFKDLRSVAASLFFLAGAAAAHCQATGTWQPLVNQPTFLTAGATIPILLTDGSVMVQDNGNYISTNHWWKLTPDASGSYVNGTWTQLADAPANYAPLYYASAVLADGRVVVIGGEANYQNYDWTNLGAIYDPVANSWTPLAAPPGWDHVGDAECAVLPNGKFMLANSYSGDFVSLPLQAAILDPTTLTWTPASTSGKENNFDEEGWTLLPDGTILTLDVEATPNAEKYIPWDDDWVPAGQTQAPFTDPSYGYEMGPAVLRFDGTVFQGGANPHTAIYTPPATPSDPGSWAAGPDFPNGYGMADAPACLMPNGNVLLFASPGLFDYPAAFFEFDGTSLNQAPPTPNCPVDTSFYGGMLVLPNGQVMFTDCSDDVEIYTPTGGPRDAWRPTISSASAFVRGGVDYGILGTQFNGLSQTNAYGDDWSNATNYPIVRITNLATGHVFYTRTHDHSTMGVATGTQSVSTHFTVPSSVELGASKIEVVANGIPSASQSIYVGYQWSGFLSPLAKQQFKTGSNIPIKFKLTGVTAGVTNMVANGYWATVNGNIVGPDQPIGTFVYFAATGSYQLNWKTSGLLKGTYQIKAVFDDGSVHTIQVILK